MTDSNKNVTDLISPILQILWHVKKTKQSSLTTCTCLLWIVDKGLQGGSFQQRQRQRVTEAVKISETYCCSRRFHRFEPPPLGKVNFICQYDIINALSSCFFFTPRHPQPHPTQRIQCLLFKFQICVLINLDKIFQI